MRQRRIAVPLAPILEKKHEVTINQHIVNNYD